MEQDRRFKKLLSDEEQLARKRQIAENNASGMRKNIDTLGKEAQNAERPWYTGNFRNDGPELRRPQEAERKLLQSQEQVRARPKQEMEEQQQAVKTARELDSRAAELEREAAGLREQGKATEAAAVSGRVKEIRSRLNQHLNQRNGLIVNTDTVDKRAFGEYIATQNETRMALEEKIAAFERTENRLRQGRDGLVVTEAVLATGGMGVAAGAAVGTGISIVSAIGEQAANVAVGNKDAKQAVVDGLKQTAKASIDSTIAAASVTTGGAAGQVVGRAVGMAVGGGAGSMVSSTATAIERTIEGTEGRSIGQIVRDVAVDASIGAVAGVIAPGAGRAGAGAARRVAVATREIVADVALGTAGEAVKATADGRSVSIGDAVTGAVNAAVASTAGRVTREASHVGELRLVLLPLSEPARQAKQSCRPLDLRKLLRA